MTDMVDLEKVRVCLHGICKAMIESGLPIHMLDITPIKDGKTGIVARITVDGESKLLALGFELDEMA